jgi:hypothetical protein
MKTVLCFLAIAVPGVSLAQDNYLIEFETSSTIVQVYPNVLVGKTLVRLLGFLPSQQVSLDSFPYQIEEYFFNGVDATGTLHLSKSTSEQDDDYEVSSVENYVFGGMSVVLSPGPLDGPFVKLDMEDIGNGELSVTLTNAGELEPLAQ